MVPLFKRRINEKKNTKNRMIQAFESQGKAQYYHSQPIHTDIQTHVRACRPTRRELSQ